MATVYWATRELDGGSKFSKFASGAGNHHFVLVVLAEGDSFAVPVLSEGKTRFFTLGGHNVGGRLRLKINDTAEVASVLEWLNPKEYTSTWTQDYGFQSKEVTHRNLNGAEFARRLVKASRTYRKTESSVKYELFGNNCTAWVASIFKALKAKPGVSGDTFWGVDSGCKRTGLWKRFVVQAK